MKRCNHKFEKSKCKGFEAYSYKGYAICVYNGHHFRCHELKLYGFNSMTACRKAIDDTLELRAKFNRRA